jgi:RNA polymerase sigma-70 factor (ECF subfamily)
MSDRKLLQQLFTAHAGQVVDFLRRRLSHKADAEDISQDVFLRMLRVEDLSGIRDPQGYLFTVANNLRRERRYTAGWDRDRVRVSLEKAMESEPELEVQLTADLDIDREGQLHQLERAVQQLSERDRAILTMRYGEGLSFREIARRLGWASKSAVERALAVAVAHCRECLKQMENA